MSAVRSFAAFLYDFLVGEDGLLFAVVVLAVAATALLGHAGADVWWLLPPIVAAGLAWSVARAARRR